MLDVAFGMDLLSGVWVYGLMKEELRAALVVVKDVSLELLFGLVDVD